MLSTQDGHAVNKSRLKTFPRDSNDQGPIFELLLQTTVEKSSSMSSQCKMCTLFLHKLCKFSCAVFCFPCCCCSIVYIIKQTRLLSFRVSRLSCAKSSRNRIEMALHIRLVDNKAMNMVEQ